MFAKQSRLCLLAGISAIVLLTLAGFVSKFKTTYIVTDSGVSTSVTCLGSGRTALKRLGLFLGEGDSYSEADLGNNVCRLTVNRSAFLAAPSNEVIVNSSLVFSGDNRLRDVTVLYRPGKNAKEVSAEEKEISASPAEAAPEPAPAPAEIQPAVQTVPASVPYLSYHEEGYYPAGSGGTLITPDGETLSYSSVLSCSATAYTTERQSNKITATGTVAHVGGIAVDPTVIPYGTKLYIISEAGSWSYGYATAEDCGGGIKGNKIDLFFDTYDECINFGVRNALVYVLS